MLSSVNVFLVAEIPHLAHHTESTKSSIALGFMGGFPNMTHCWLGVQTILKLRLFPVLVEEIFTVAIAGIVENRRHQKALYTSTDAGIRKLFPAPIIDEFDSPRFMFEDIGGGHPNNNSDKSMDFTYPFDIEDFRTVTGKEDFFAKVKAENALEMSELAYSCILKKGRYLYCRCRFGRCASFIRYALQEGRFLLTQYENRHNHCTRAKNRLYSEI